MTQLLTTTLFKTLVCLASLTINRGNARGNTVNGKNSAPNTRNSGRPLEQWGLIESSQFRRAISNAGILALMVVTTAVAYADTASDAPPIKHPGDVQYQRIISAGGSITEIIHALGLMDNVIAVDSSSLYPPAVHQLPKVGYFRSLGAEGLLSLSPDLLIAARGAGPSSVLSQVENSGVMVRQFAQSTYTLGSWKALVSDVGRFFGKQDQATALITTAIKNIKAAQKSRLYAKQEINAIALLNSGQRGPIAAGANTMPDLLMELAGINNLAGDLEGYKPYSTESLASKKLDLILVPHHNLEGMGGIEGVCKQTAIKFATVDGCNVQVMDALLLLGFGSRIDEAVTQIIEQANNL